MEPHLATFSTFSKMVQGQKKWEVDSSDDITFQVLRLLCLLLRSHG